MRAFLILIYIAAMVIANVLVFWLGPWFSPVNAFVLIGLDLTLRDVMQERLTHWQLGGTILAGGLITLFINPAAQFIAIASASAFMISACVDWTVYTILQHKRWMVKSNVSNIFGAAADSIIFPTIAFGVLLPWIIFWQFIAKVTGGFIWSLIVGYFRGRADLPPADGWPDADAELDRMADEYQRKRKAG